MTESPWNEEVAAPAEIEDAAPAAAVPADACEDAAPPEETLPLFRRSDEVIAASVCVAPRAPLVQCRGREYVLISRETQNWIRTNRVGMEILERCNRFNTVAEIAEDVAAEYGLPAELALASCVMVVKGALAAGYLEEGYEKLTMDVWFHVTDACNMRCPFCYRGEPEPSDSHRSMTVDAWSRMLDGMTMYPRITVKVTGGEPTLYPDLIPLLEMLRERPNVKHVCLISNGTGVSIDTYKKLAGLVSTLQISCDGVTPEANDRIRGAGNFERVTTLLLALKEAGCPNISVSFTPIRGNFNEMSRMVGFALSHGATGLHINRLMPAGRALGHYRDIVITRQEFSRALEQTIAQYRTLTGQWEMYGVADMKAPLLKLTFADASRIRVGLPRNQMMCSMGTETVSISCYGDVSPCTSLALPEFTHGNVQDEPFRTIHNRMATAVRAISVKDIESCAGCGVQGLCAGGCRARAFHLNGDLMGHDPLCPSQDMLDMMFSMAPVSFTAKSIFRKMSEESGEPILSGEASS